MFGGRTMIEKIKKYVKTAIAGVLVLSLVLQAFYGMQYVLASEENTELTSPQSYTIKLTNATQVFIYNERETTAYPITLRYTVASAEQNCYKTGAIATEEPEATIPYENQKGSLVSNGRVFTSKQGVYEIQLQKTSENVIQYSGTLKKNDDSSVDLTANYSNVAHLYAGVPNSNATHFGIWIDKDTTNTNQTDAGETAILTNVTCVDAEGNDLGVLAKAGTGTCELIKNEAESYTVAMDSATQVFISNKSPAEAYQIT